MILAISTSQSNFSFSVLRDGGVINYKNLKDQDTTKLNFSDLLSDSLKEDNISFADISEIIVDVGPGGTSSVRTGVAVANALAYALDVSIMPVTSLEIIAKEVMQSYGTDVKAVVVIPSIKNNCFVGIATKNEFKLSYGLIDAVFESGVGANEKVVLAGNKKVIDKLNAHYNNYQFIESGIAHVNTEFMFAEGLLAQRKSKTNGIIVPINELNYSDFK